jgi:hypothetical protein
MLSFHVHLYGEVVLSAYDGIQQGAVWMSILRLTPISLWDSCDMADLDTDNGRTTNRLRAQVPRISI